MDDELILNSEKVYIYVVRESSIKFKSVAFYAGVFRIFSCDHPPMWQKATKNLGQTRPLLKPHLWGGTRAPRNQNSAFRCCFICYHSRVAPPNGFQ